MIKPCPFCGDTTCKDNYETNFSKVCLAVQCKCGASGPRLWFDSRYLHLGVWYQKLTTQVIEENRHLAIAAWNMRKL